MNIMRPARVSLITSAARPRNLFFPSHPSVHYARELRLSSETLAGEKRRKKKIEEKKRSRLLCMRASSRVLCARAGRDDKMQGDASDNACALLGTPLSSFNVEISRHVGVFFFFFFLDI